MPSTNRTVAVVESQRWDDRRHGGPRSLKGSRPWYDYTCHRVEPPSRLVWRKDTYSIVFIVRLAHTTSICLLARDGRTMPSANSTVTDVESQRRGNRRHCGPRAFKGESPFVCLSWGGVTLSPCLAQRHLLYRLYSTLDPIPRPYARWLATAVPCRQRAAQSPL